MNQRVMIAMAIACNPRLLIADEPTTALDVTIQAQILDLLLQLQEERGMALVLITHDMGVVAETAERVAVMYAGQMVEERKRGDRCSPRRTIRTPPRCSPRCPSATSAARGSPPFRRRRRAPRPAGCLFAPRCAFATDAAGPRRRFCRLPTATSAVTFRSATRRAQRERRADGARWADAGASARACRAAQGRIPECAARRSARSVAAPAVVARDLTRAYEVRRGLLRHPALLHALDGITFAIEPGGRSPWSASRAAESPRWRGSRR